MRYFFLLIILASCGTPNSTQHQVVETESPKKLEYQLTSEGMKEWLGMVLSALDQTRGTDFLKKEKIEIISGPEALLILKEHGESITSYEKQLLKRPDAKVVYMKVQRGLIFPAGFLWVFAPENLKSSTSETLRTYTLGVKKLPRKQSKTALPLLKFPEFEKIPASGLFAIAPISATYRPIHWSLSQAEVPVDGSFVFLIGKSPHGRAFLKPLVGDFRVSSILTFRDGELTDYVASCRSEQSIRHLMYRNGFTKHDPGLSVRWKKEIDKEDLVRALSWSTDLSATDLSNLDLKNAFFAGLFFSGTDFSQSDLRGANFNGARLYYTDFTGANLKGTTFKGAIWGNTICPDGSLSEANSKGTCL